MDFFVPPQEILYRYSDYIEEFQAILAASKIKFGSPDNFTAFARRLQSDDVLSADLDRMVRSIIQRETGNISLRTILTIIAVASGGPTAADPNRDFSKPKQLVIGAMIASGGCSPADAEHLDGLCQSAPAIQSNETTLPNDASPDITGSLTRLELNASEAMHYLDSIEQRIARMEPFLEALPFSETPASSPAVAPAPPPLVEPPFIPAELPTNTSHIRITLNDSIDRFADFLFTRKFEFRNNFFTGTFTRRPFGVTFPSRFFSYTFAYKFFRYRVTDKLFSYPFVHKLLHYKFSDRLLSNNFSNKLLTYRVDNKFIQRAVAVPLSLAAVVGTTLLYLSIEHNHHPVIQPPTAPTTEASAIPPIKITNKPQLTVTADPLDKSTNEPTVKQQPHKPSPYLSQTSTVTPSHPQRLTEPAPASPSSSAAAAIAPAASHATTEDETPTPTATTSSHSVRYALTSLPSKLRLSPSHTIDVSSGVMASNLVSATPPTYPKLASLTHMQGKVVMEAIIAKNGTVQSLQVLEGHHLLRSAAKNAVRSWRYRPYLIDDKPVEVATIVTVDFNLPH
ncbi:TonB family protein [Edaphobacter aggregans]|uniref:TonB family protein n=1 Tax=Edaphobacter aggregans TaxID=570835 RepID=A0A428MDA9_9BACT|nr:energy transducer TonB [Edaphobacter aggregans]RSL14854.1 TonB family protein [Edaphobacter aggregans]